MTLTTFCPHPAPRTPLPALRHQFPVTDRWAYFDHAGVSPLPRVSADAITAYAADFARDGVGGILPYVQRVEECRTAVARLLACDPLDVAFTANTSAGIGIVAEGFPWRPGDNVVIAAEEYPANVYPWTNLRDRGVTVGRVPSRGNRVAIDDIAAAIDGRTRIVSLSWVQYSSGYRLPLAAVGDLCRSRGVAFCVDAIQGLGVFPLDVHACGIDFLAADGHKWLLGPQGAGLAYIRREWVERLRPVGVGWQSAATPFDFGNVDQPLKPHAGRWEGGTHNIPGIVGLLPSVELLLSVGLDAVAARILHLTDYFTDAALRAGWSVFSDRTGDARSGIVSVTIPGRDPAERMRFAKAHGVLVNNRGGRLRVSPHAYNTEGEIDRTVEVLCRQP